MLPETALPTSFRSRTFANCNSADIVVVTHTDEEGDDVGANDPPMNFLPIMGRDERLSAERLRMNGTADALLNARANMDENATRFHATYRFCKLDRLSFELYVYQRKAFPQNLFFPTNMKQFQEKEKSRIQAARDRLLEEDLAKKASIRLEIEQEFAALNTANDPPTNRKKAKKREDEDE